MRGKRSVMFAAVAVVLAGSVGVGLAATGHGKSGEHGQGAQHRSERAKGDQKQGQEATGRDDEGSAHVAVLICHHTHSKKNPVVAIVTDQHAGAAHRRHGDLVITSDVPAPEDRATRDSMCGVSDRLP